MTVPIRLPVAARPNVTRNVFRAVWNAVTPGRYNFTGTAANVRQTVLQLNQGCVYVVDRILLSAIIPETLYQEAIDPAIDVPVGKIETNKTKQMIFPKKQPLLNYEAYEVVKPFFTDQKDDLLMMSFEGIFWQPGAMIGLLNFDVFVQFTIYEIQATSWVSKFVAPKEGEGAELALRGKDLSWGMM